MEIPNQIMVEGVALAVERLLTAQGEQLAAAIAEAMSKRLELLQPEAAAALLGVTTRTLNDRHVDWGIDKSVTFGATNPRYLLSQVLEAAQRHVVRGKRPKAPTLHVATERKAA